MRRVVLLLSWKQRERRERENFVYVFFCVFVICGVLDDFCQKFVCATLFVQKSNVKREEEEENLIMSFFQEREKRDLLVRFQIELFSIENVY
jgi:hypothetical protein